MTLEMIVRPLYSLTCDQEECTEEIRSSYEWELRPEAARAGWSVRPNRGPGSRTAPDLCPDHKTLVAGETPAQVAR